jgi:hypothetical protein
MEQLQWFEIDSWHILREIQMLNTGMGDDVEEVEWAVSLCGLKSANAVPTTDRPGNEATCENCLRILTKD